MINPIILKKIKAYNRIIIHGHQRPDGDCYGAQFGLKNIIQSSFPEKEVYVVGETSDFVSFIGTPDIIEDSYMHYRLLSILQQKKEFLTSAINLVKKSLKLTTTFQLTLTGITWVDTNYPSCAQMIAHFYTRYKKELKLTYEGALAMYTGILTDTGRFQRRIN